MKSRYEFVHDARERRALARFRAVAGALVVGAISALGFAAGDASSDRPAAGVAAFVADCSPDVAARCGNQP
ncbi:MAG: hypothetical protein BroJett031_22780 [Betaproteobacteria bacterium]|nr:MAG: hypothetical protein BroJett031_22780 [Betaproteobacteria bacterium]